MKKLIYLATLVLLSSGCAMKHHKGECNKTSCSAKGANGESCPLDKSGCGDKAKNCGAEKSCHKDDHKGCGHKSGGEKTGSDMKGAGTESHEGEHVASHGQWGKATYHKFSSFYFLGKPDLATLTQAKADGVSVVVNLSAADEKKAGKFDEKVEAEKLGLTYYALPVSEGKALDGEQMKAIDETVMKHHHAGEKVLIHSSKGQLSAAWFAHHYQTMHKADVNESLEMAKKLGLEKKSLVKKTQAFLELQAK